MPSYASYRVRGARNRRNTGYRSNRSSNNNRNKNRKQFISPERFVKAAKPVEVSVYSPTNTFADFDIHPLLKENVSAKGYKIPSPIQDQAIPYALQHKDVIGIANTGTGKTAAFAIPVLNRLLKDKSAKAIILAPTRELAQQIESECISFAKRSGLFGVVLIGGAPMGRQLSGLRRNPNIVIGTPGRIKDHIERGSLDLSKFNMVVLDEADRMVDMGFINDIRTILSKVSANRQSLFFSATVDQKIAALIQTFMIDPVTVSVKQGDTSDNVEQNVVRYASSSEKITKLKDLLSSSDISKVLIFDETKRSVDRLSKDLATQGFRAGAIHGGKTQGHRQRTLRNFRESNIKILVATDVAARGIDVDGITHVINYSTPSTYDDYIHRIGRAGRAGKRGHALTFVSS